MFSKKSMRRTDLAEKLHNGGIARTKGGKPLPSYRDLTCRSLGEYKFENEWQSRLGEDVFIGLRLCRIPVDCLKGGGGGGWVASRVVGGGGARRSRGGGVCVETLWASGAERG